MEIEVRPAEQIQLKTVHYGPGFTAVSDFEASEVAKRFLYSDETTLYVSTWMVVDAIRAEVASGKFPNNLISISDTESPEKNVKVDRYGSMNSYPQGSDIHCGILLQILDGRDRVKKPESRQSLE